VVVESSNGGTLLLVALGLMMLGLTPNNLVLGDGNRHRNSSNHLGVEKWSTKKVKSVAKTEARKAVKGHEKVACTALKKCVLAVKLTST
jgi:hypothetical protein